MESSTISPAVGRAVDAPTLGEALRRTAINHPDIVAVRTPDDSVSLTWSDLLRRVEDVAGGLAKLGVGHGDTVAIMLGNRPEFHIVDLAAAMLGATPFSIYQTYPPEDIQYLISDAGAKVAIVEQAYLAPTLEARRDLPALAHVIVVDSQTDAASTISLADVEASNPGYDPTNADVGPDDVVTLIYTSGTTGPPKGVQLSHHNIMAAARAVEQVITFPPGSRVISWLASGSATSRSLLSWRPKWPRPTSRCSRSSARCWDSIR
jgi:long-subunit acyl-CoA synthetase (AMP-forming)